MVPEVEKEACNALLLKVNQIGSVTEAIDAATLSQKNGWGAMGSHRSARALRSTAGGEIASD